jgi:hypothetical protein
VAAGVDQLRFDQSRFDRFRAAADVAPWRRPAGRGTGKSGGGVGRHTLVEAPEPSKDAEAPLRTGEVTLSPARCRINDTCAAAADVALVLI